MFSFGTNEYVSQQRKVQIHYLLLVGVQFHVPVGYRPP